MPDDAPQLVQARIDLLTAFREKLIKWHDLFAAWEEESLQFAHVEGPQEPSPEIAEARFALNKNLVAARQAVVEAGVYTDVSVVVAGGGRERIDPFKIMFRAVGHDSWMPDLLDMLAQAMRCTRGGGDAWAHPGDDASSGPKRIAVGPRGRYEQGVGGISRAWREPPRPDGVVESCGWPTSRYQCAARLVHGMSRCTQSSTDRTSHRSSRKVWTDLANARRRRSDVTNTSAYAEASFRCRRSNLLTAFRPAGFVRPTKPTRERRWASALWMQCRRTGATTSR